MTNVPKSDVLPGNMFAARNEAEINHNIRILSLPMDALRLNIMVTVGVALVFVLLNELFRAMDSEIRISWISYLTFLLGYAIATKLSKRKE